MITHTRPRVSQTQSVFEFTLPVSVSKTPTERQPSDLNVYVLSDAWMHGILSPSVWVRWFSGVELCIFRGLQRLTSPYHAFYIGMRNWRILPYFPLLMHRIRIMVFGEQFPIAIVRSFSPLRVYIIVGHKFKSKISAKYWCFDIDHHG